MKKKIAVILLSVSMAVISLNGCGKSDKKAKKDIAREWENEDAVHGEVSEVSEDTVIIKVADGNMDSTAGLESTGEEQEITVTKDTVIKRRNMRGMPENGDVSQQPDSRPGTENGGMPEQPDSRQGMEERGMPSGWEGEVPAGEMPDREESSEEITISDISVGDMVMVTFTDNNSAAEITVLPSKGDGDRNGTPKSKGSDQRDSTV